MLSNGQLEDKLYCVLEYGDIGTIYDLVMSCNTLKEPLARFYFGKLVEAVDHLHRERIAHRDIKPLNIMLKSDEHILKLGDFGHSAVVSNIKEEDYVMLRGTVQYRAPECCDPKNTGKGKVHDPFAADIFSCATVLIAMVLGHELFFNDGKILNCPVYQLIKDGNIE
jgi:serine/threonine protein kinase